MTKKKAIFIDFGDHFKQQEHCIELWNDYDVSIVSKSSNYSRYNEHGKFTFIGLSERMYELKLYLILMFGFLYDKIVFVTPPEYGFSKGIKRELFDKILSFVSIIYGDKTVVYIKNPDKYIESRVLSRLIDNAQMIFCESEYQKSYFLDKFPKYKLKTFVSYVYYYKKHIDIRKNSLAVNVGILGQFDSERRDYQILISALENSALNSERIKFYQIGRFVNTLENVDLKNRLVNKGVFFLKDDFTNSELDSELSKMDFFISLNKKELYVGGKGTACFSEAVQYGKPLIVPSFMSIYSEFSSFCTYYDDHVSLGKELVKVKEKKIEMSNYDSYSAMEVKDAIIREGGYFE